MEKKIKWFKDALVYQIYPLSFKDSNNDGIGDINGIASKLDYLKTLGVDVIWLSPVYQSPMRDNGYDISDYHKINPIFGTMDDMKSLIQKVHDKGMRLIMDLVINHTSDEHEWFKKSKANDPKYRDYYIWRDEPTDIESIFGGPAWTYDEISKSYYFHLFAKSQPDLNWHHKEMRQEIYDMINMWLDLGIDGFRLDVIDLIGKDIDKKMLADGPYLETYLKELNETCFKSRDIMTVGETPGLSIKRSSELTSEDNPYLDMVFQFSHIGLDEIPGKGKWALKKLDVLELKETFNKVQHTFYKQGWNALFLANHDQPRALTRYGSLLYPKHSAMMLATLIYGMQGTPFVYQGEEIAMTGIKHEDISKYKDIETLQIYDILKKQGINHKDIMESIYAKGRDNSRTPFQWDDTLYAGFSNKEPWLGVNPNYKDLNAAKDLADQQSVFAYFKKLFQIRKTNEVFRLGDFQLYEKDNKDHFSYYRSYKQEKFLIICSFKDHDISFKLPHEKFEIIHTNYQNFVFDKEVVLPPYFSCILKIGD
ncbi:MAG: alpha-glucosidase [Acholeplasmataceae bacterium]|nr:alpha-glucosidase [Acholeplasmataceae bacterium]